MCNYVSIGNFLSKGIILSYIPTSNMSEVPSLSSFIYWVCCQAYRFLSLWQVRNVISVQSSLTRLLLLVSFKHLFTCLKAICIFSPELLVHAYCSLVGFLVVVFILPAPFQVLEELVVFGSFLAVWYDKIFPAHVICFLPQTEIQHFSKELGLL